MLIQGQELTVSWLGDSQAILVRRGQAVTLMDPHKPDREVEILHIPKYIHSHTHKKNKEGCIYICVCV